MVRKKINKEDAISGYLMISPWIINFICFIMIPMVISLVLIFFKWDLISKPSFIGFDNLRRLSHDDLFLKSLLNTFYYTFIGVPLHIIIALFLAVALNLRIRLIKFYRLLYFIPFVMPASAVAIVWLYLLYPDFGFANITLNWLHLPELKWLLDPVLSKPILIFIYLWQFGQTMIIFLAALQGVPDSYYEAAEIDGASRWRKFVSITLPIISPTIFFNFVLNFAWSFQVFSFAYIMTKGGPNNSTLFYVLNIWRNAFEYFRMGYASLLSWILFVVILIFTIIQFKLQNKWVFYETK